MIKTSSYVSCFLGLIFSLCAIGSMAQSQSSCTNSTSVEQHGELPVVLWPKPAHAHPEVPFQFTLVAYDPENQSLCYTLKDAPEGMTINDSGMLSWEKPVSGYYSFVVNVSDGSAEVVPVEIQIDVDADRFIFVSTDGSASGAGTLDDPLNNIEEGLERLAKLDWGTLYIRGGTYATPWNWEAKQGRSSPLRGVKGTPEHPYSVRGYPGEQVVLDSKGGHGPWSYGATYVIFADLEVRNASVEERGGIVLESYALAQNVTVRDSDWTYLGNCTGFMLRGEETICHRCKGIDNYDRDSEHWNSTNYITYPNSDDGDGALYILDSYSSGSRVGYKIKHSGTGKLIIHGSVSEHDEYGYGGMDRGSTVRYNTIRDAQYGIVLGVTDIAEETTGPMLVEHNLVMNSRVALSVTDGYGDNGNIQVKHNQFVTSEEMSDAWNGVKMVRLWPNQSRVPEKLSIDYNCYVAPGFDAGFRLNHGRISFSEWQESGFDQHSKAGKNLCSQQLSTMGNIRWLAY
jgi:hypothetical protein